ncbi:MAG: T9SS type A sorting domain-containing protein [Chlorobi bacterium]|nr:T9SS type A sorting domain-containing protein [Chlorobiota bacterium]
MKIKSLIIITFLLFATAFYAGIGDGTSTEGALPVELTSFTASTNSFSVILNWTTATEVDNYGFEVERALSRLVGTTPRQDEWKNIGFVQGHGNSNSYKNYSFIDKTVLPEVYKYRLKQIDTDGNFNFSNIIEVQFCGVPKNYSLAQNYPNPFNPTTVIEYSIPNVADGNSLFVQLKVYDLLGNEVTTLINKRRQAGSYKISFNASDLSAGVYIYRIEAGTFSAAKKMILLK